MIALPNNKQLPNLLPIQHDGLKDALQKALASLAPPRDLTVSEWADAYRYLSPEASDQPGKWNTATAEYQRGMMDAVTDDHVEEVVFMTGAQLGKTEILNNIIGYFIAEDPCPMMMVQPTLEMGQSWSKDRLANMLRDTPVLAALIKDPKARDSGNTVLHKTFRGGHITVAGANSPTGLRMRPVRAVFQDEIDAYPLSAGTEGDPCNLADARTKRFWNRKKIKASTPTSTHSSRIVKAFEQSDQRYYHIPCPLCGHMQHLVWAQVKWGQLPDGSHDPDSARYHCIECDYPMDDAERWNAIANSGEWQSMAPFKGIAGFHLNELYSPWTRLGEIVTKFIAAKRGGPEMLKTFVNTELGEPWTEDTQHLDPTGLLSRTEAYGPTIPHGVLLLTAGVDVQDDRLVVEVKGWNRNECWSMDWRTFKGTPTPNSPVWDDLDQYLLKAWPTEFGPSLRISCTFIDMGGHYSSSVYDFCRPRAARRVYPCKGASVAGQPVVTATRKLVEGCQLQLVGTDTTKGLIHAYLKNDTPGPGYWHFSRYVNDLDYFKQLTSETMSLAYKNGQYVYIWKPTKGVRNEALDCTVYAYAALESLNVDWPSVEQAIQAASATWQQQQAVSKPAYPVTPSATPDQQAGPGGQAYGQVGQAYRINLPLLRTRK